MTVTAAQAEAIADLARLFVSVPLSSSGPISPSLKVYSADGTDGWLWAEGPRERWLLDQRGHVCGTSGRHESEEANG